MRELGKVAAFGALPPAAFGRLAALGRERAYADGEALMRQGEAGDAMYAILAGRARVERAHPDLPAPLVLAELGPGELVGELGALDGRPRWWRWGRCGRSSWARRRWRRRCWRARGCGRRTSWRST